ncbi:peptidase [Mycobacterium phage Iwokeuplikedis]|nr:peptidase [Mycobacterium phage Iwokeuplikedis]
MGRGRGGSGPGTGAKNKKSTGTGTGAGSGGAGGGSAGGGGGGSKGTGSAGTGGVTGGGGGNGAGGGSGPTQTSGGKLSITYGDGLTDKERAFEEYLFEQMPTGLRKRLHERGLKVYVGRKASETPGWPEFAADRGLTPDSKFADGREYGTLSFYAPDRREIYISVHNPGGSVNVYTHEMGHAVDYLHSDSGRISEDPDWVSLHNTHIKDNPDIDSYYRGGPTGNNAGSGRRELFAEGFAMYNKYGYDALVNWTHSTAAADKMIAVWKRYGVFE